MLAQLALSALVLNFAHASSCIETELLRNPKLDGNAQFWEEFTALKTTGKGSEFHFRELADRFGVKVDPPATPAPPFVQPRSQVIASKEAQKEIRGLPQGLKKKFDSFADLASQPQGIRELYKNPGAWHFEDVSATFGPHHHTVRLSEGYRVLFALDPKTKDVKIKRVNKGQIHGN